ncbi:MAG: GTPase [Cyanobacteria bacterium P01_A01_bin.17]
MAQLIFVYNADSGGLNALFDIAHKVVSPETYSCSLCMLTHGVLSERTAWKTFRESSPVPLTFLHRDEFEERYLPLQSYPVVLLEQNRQMETVMTADALNKLSTIDQLIEILQQQMPVT